MRHLRSLQYLQAALTFVLGRVASRRQPPHPSTPPSIQAVCATASPDKAGGQTAVSHGDMEGKKVGEERRGEERGRGGGGGEE